MVNAFEQQRVIDDRLITHVLRFSTNVPCAPALLLLTTRITLLEVPQLQAALEFFFSVAPLDAGRHVSPSRSSSSTLYAISRYPGRPVVIQLAVVRTWLWRGIGTQKATLFGIIGDQ